GVGVPSRRWAMSRDGLGAMPGGHAALLSAVQAWPAFGGAGTGATTATPGSSCISMSSSRWGAPRHRGGGHLVPGRSQGVPSGVAVGVTVGDAGQGEDGRGVQRLGVVAGHDTERLLVVIGVALG